MEGRFIAKLLKPNDRSVQLTEVRLIGANGEQLGVVSYRRAHELAQEEKMDLMLVSDTAKPPVVRIMDYGKLCYEQNKNLKAQRKNAQGQKLKEVKFHLNIDQHDYDIKIKKALDFLEKKCKLKVTLALRGREMARQEMAMELMRQIIEAISPYGEADGQPKLLGRNISVNFAAK